MGKWIVGNLEIYLIRLFENCDERNYGQKKQQKTRKHWNEIQKPSAWYALGLKIPENQVRFKVRIEEIIENKICLTTWVALKTVVEPYTDPKNRPIDA